VTPRIAVAAGAGLVLRVLSLDASQAPVTPQPVEPLSAIVEAFVDHNVVTVTDPHGSEQVQAFLLRLLTDRRLAEVANDIVLESASARYQDALDRFVRGDDIAEAVVRGAWEDTTQPQASGEQTAELVRTVRLVNRSLPAGRRLRVLAGDPPIDWTHVTSAADHFRWIELRDSHPADVIVRQVLERGRRVLVVYGQMHSQRWQSATNYEMSSWQAQTLISLITAVPSAQVFTVWTLNDDRRMPDGVSAWPQPSLLRLKGTAFGAMDFATYSPLPSRFRVTAGRLGEPLPRAEWRALPMEQQFDALLYLGPPVRTTGVPVSAARCADSQFVATRLARIALAGIPPAEGEQLRESCIRATVSPR
jgi:hypothetical protein